MQTQIKKERPLLNALITILLIFFLLADIYWIYLKYFAPDSFTELVVNASTVEDTNGKHAVCQVKYYENADNTGIELLEVQFTGYTDTTQTNISSFGVQIVGSINDLKATNNFKKTTKKNFLNMALAQNRYYTFISNLSNKKYQYGQMNFDAGKLCFYKESDNLNYANVDTAFDDFGYIRFSIDDTIYALQPGVVYSSYKEVWTTCYKVSSLSEFILNMQEIASSCPVGHSAKTFIFKDMFRLFEYKNGKYEEVSLQDNIFTNLFIDFEHYTTGATTANDSMFKMIQYNTNYTINGSSLLDEHFSDKALYKLTEQDFVFNYSEETSGHVGTLNDSCYNYLVKNNIKNLHIVIDKDYLTSIGCVYTGLSKTYLEAFNIAGYYIIENGVKIGGEIWN